MLKEAEGVGISECRPPPSFLTDVVVMDREYLSTALRNTLDKKIAERGVKLTPSLKVITKTAMGWKKRKEGLQGNKTLNARRAGIQTPS